MKQSNSPIKKQEEKTHILNTVILLITSPFEPTGHIPNSSLNVDWMYLVALGIVQLHLSPAHTVWFWPRFGHLGQILKTLKDSYNPRLKFLVFDCWFDMFTDSRFMVVAIKFHLRRNSGSVKRFGSQSCSVTTPTMNFSIQTMSRINARELFYQS